MRIFNSKEKSIDLPPRVKLLKLIGNVMFVLFKKKKLKNHLMTPFPPPPTYSGNLKHILTGGLLAETVLPRVMPIQRQTCKLLNGDRAWGSCGTPLHLRRRPGMLLFAGCCAGGRGRMAHCDQNTFGNQTLREKAPDTLKG